VPCDTLTEVLVPGSADGDGGGGLAPAAVPSASARPFADHVVTERLVLRRFASADAGPLAAYRSDPGTARYQGWSTPYPLEAAEAFVAEVAAADPGVPGTAFQFAIEGRTSPGLIGDVMLATGEDRRLVEVGVTLAPAARGEGLATEALTALLEHLFADAGVHRVEARCDPRNTASRAVFERLGFRQEGHLVAAYWDEVEGWLDDVILAMLADDRRVARVADRASPPRR
jgi:RimJ/RimL family protein N-acetyltransferase